MKTPILAFLYPNRGKFADEAEEAQLDADIIGLTAEDIVTPVVLNETELEKHLKRSIARAIKKALVRKPQADNAPFVWVTHKGQALFVTEMATPHLFYSLRMIYNNTVPPVFRILGEGDTFNRYADVPQWTPEYRTQAITAFIDELKKRDDLEDDLRVQIDDMAANTKVILALGI